LKVLFLINDLSGGGKERQLVELMKGLYAQSISCELAISRNNVHYKEVFELIPELHILATNRLKALVQVYRIIKNHRVDIVHSFIAETSFLASLCSIILGFKFVEESVRSAPDRTYFSFKKKTIDRFNFFFAHKVISNSKAGLISYHAPVKKSAVIYNGFDFSRIKKIKTNSEILAKLAIPKDKFVIGMLANFSYYKDYFTFFEVAEKLLIDRNDIVFVAIGDGTDLAAYRNKYKAHKSIVFTGSIKNVEEIVNIFDIGVLLSTVNEGVSNSIMEYMALGKAVVATSGGGTNELVINNETGCLIQPFSADELALKINYLLNNSDIRNNMGLKGQKRIRDHFKKDKMVNSHIQIYKELLIK
jgi:glycosyltransferase involved in cell wall biosynthesis